MDSETEPIAPAVEPPIRPAVDNVSFNATQDPERPYRGLKWMFIGPTGIRAGWSVLIFIALFLLFATCLAFVFVDLHLVSTGGVFGPKQAFYSQVLQVTPLVGAIAIMAFIEGRHFTDYNLRGPHRVLNFVSGCVVGFAALSALVGALALGGWLHLGPMALHGSQIVKYAVAWAATFLLVGCFEEGSMRCYLQYTLTRGINFWWAAGLIALMCVSLIFRTRGNGAWGVYSIALLGLLPCFLLHVQKVPSGGFWQAAWLTSTFFGFGHTSNNGENWIGIFAAAFIGFAFCVSIWLTGSAWWAIGCHAAWDWAETYFYGTADSGLVAKGHLLSSSPAGNPLWSGGTDGPEGSLLIIPIVLLILACLLVMYRRPRAVEIPAPAASEPSAG